MNVENSKIKSWISICFFQFLLASPFTPMLSQDYLIAEVK